MQQNDLNQKSSFLDKKFRYSEKGSSLKTEIIAGLTTFLAMSYILVVNAGLFAKIKGSPVSFDAMYVTTALSAIIGTVLIGDYWQTYRSRKPPEWDLTLSSFSRFATLSTLRMPTRSYSCF